MFKIFCAIVLLACVSTSQCNAEEEVNNVTRDSFALTISNMFGSKPFFETRNENGRFLGFHIPFIADWSIHNREGDGILNTGYHWRWLSGVVNLTYDKTRDPATGLMRGPVKFSMFGIPLWDNGQTKPTPPPAEPQLAAPVDA